MRIYNQVMLLREEFVLFNYLRGKTNLEIEFDFDAIE